MNVLINRKAIILLTLILVVAMTSAASTESKLKPGWTDENFAEDIRNCRLEMEAGLREPFLEYYKFNKDNFPIERELEFYVWLSPVLDQCNCITETLSKEVTFNEYMSRAPVAKKRVDELFSKDGACRVTQPLNVVSADRAPGPSCVRFVPDPEPFPHATIGSAILELENRRYVEGKVDDVAGISWALYQKPDGGFDVDATAYELASPYKSAMIWRRLDLTVQPNVMLVSSRCESTAADCKKFTKFLQEVELKRTLGECPGK